MGSTKVATPKSQMADQKKSIKDFLKKPFQALFSKKDKRKTEKNAKNNDNSGAVNKNVEKQPIKITPVTDILNDLKNLKIKPESDDEDEFKNFTRKVIDDTDRNNSQLSEQSFINFKKESKERNNSTLSEGSYEGFKEEKDVRRTKIDSQTSEDSGFSENPLLTATDCEDEVSEGRKKKKQFVVISRGPIRNQFLVPSHPYSREADYQKISQVNIQTFSGGHVIVNENARADNTYLSQALELIDTNIRDCSGVDLTVFLDDAEEFIKKDANDLLTSEFNVPEIVEPQPTIYSSGCYEFQNENPIEALEQANSNPISEYETLDLFNECLQNPSMDTLSVFPTPPRSENVPSPFSDSQAFYPASSDYSLSPQTFTSSPMYNSDYEKCQDIPSWEEYPSCVTDYQESEKETTNKTTGRDRKSRSSMTLKQYKDMQKDIANEFLKMECCQSKRKSCKEIFEGHLRKLKIEHRKILCQKVASLEMKTAYGVLQHILASLSKSDAEESLQLALFSLICEKVLALQPELFIQDFGLSLVKSAVLRCHRRALLTRYLVQCVRAAIAEPRECVFTEVDSLGDNLVIACARGGDAFAPALYELTSPGAPLFALHHHNNEGQNALHVACALHRADAPRLHTVHVLLHHANIDLWRKDVKGGETALHLAVNSAQCELRLVMLLFKHVAREHWKELAHTKNMSEVSVIEYARSAKKSSLKPNFPPEVLEFLQKCR